MEYIKLYEEFKNETIKNEFIDKAFDVWKNFCTQHLGKYYNANAEKDGANEHIVDQVRLNKFIFKWEINGDKMSMKIIPIDIDGGSETWDLFDETNKEMFDLTKRLYLKNNE